MKKEKYHFPDHMNVPPECDRSIFIPAYGTDGKQYYYLVDFKSKTIICWDIDTEEMKNYLINKIQKDDIAGVPWNKNFENYLQTILLGHSAQYDNGKLYVSSNYGTFILCLSIVDDSWSLIGEDIEGDPVKVYSATNDIYNNNLYFTRWEMEEGFRHIENRNLPVRLEIGRYSLEADSFEIIDTIDGPDDVHYTSITPDGKNLIIIEMAQDPVHRFPKQGEETNDDYLLKTLENGLCDSQFIVYNLEKKQYHVHHLKDGPAHIEYDLSAPGICYVSMHNLCTNNTDNCCFGTARIEKIRIDSEVASLGFYTDDDFIRIPSHKPFDYDGQKLLAVSVYPNQLHIIDADEMKLYKKVYLSKTKQGVDFSRGPYIYPRIDKTPYSIEYQRGSSYIYLCSIWNIILFNFVGESKYSSLIYNVNNKPLIAMGHAISFVMER
ncbi:hypothetical protein [Paenibacillus mesotrionivorans]|uniref:hypothetical protein n=1 Tax=Paenibacillus mesotrionivorans TaxID=3160968 RepID=UPI003A1037C3